MNAIEWLLEIPKRNAKRDFLIDTISGSTYTFEAMYEAGCRVAADLKHRGLSVGDRVAMLLHNSADFAKLYFGCLYAGVVTVPINPVLAFNEIDYILQHSGAKLLVVSPETVGQVDLDAVGKMEIEILVLEDRRTDQETLLEFEGWNFGTLPDRGGFVPFDGVLPDDTMTIVYTSGTTGRPSGVVHQISSMIDNERLFNRRVGIGPDNRFYGILAMTYLGGYHNLLLLPYTGEASVVLANTFDARSAIRFWDPVREHGVNTLWLVPTIMSILMEMDRGQDGEQVCRKQVELGLVGTAPLPVQLRKDFEKRYGITLYDNYGLSETLFVSTNAPMLPVLDGCVGHLLPGVEVSILNEGGKPLAYGEEGEIFTRTPHLMKGYYDPDSGNPEVLERDAWFPSGDIGIFTTTGDLFITGRKKDLIIRGGINISPAAIENVLYQHPAVIECAVVGVPHALYGEDIAAVVRLAEGHQFADVQSDLIRACKENLAAVRQPSHILEVEDFEHSSSGKIQKNKVRDLLIQKLGLPHRSLHNKPALEATPSSGVSGRVRQTFVRPDVSIVEQLKKYPTSIISDCMNRMGVMNSAVHPLVRGRSFCGPALTVEEVEGGNLMSHVALEYLESGDVLVIDAKGVTSRACWGGLQTFMAKERGVAGIVVYGTLRDYEDIVKYEIPVYALGLSPGGPFKGWSGNVNYPVSCAGVVVAPGDLVVGDDDGVIVVPQSLAGRILPECARRLELEQEWFDKIKKGDATLDVVGLRSKLQDFHIDFE